MKAIQSTFTKCTLQYFFQCLSFYILVKGTIGVAGANTAMQDKQLTLKH